MSTYDAIVIGAGPGGATAALLLARAGWSVAVIEKRPFPRRKVCGEFVSATNLPLFQQLGLAESFLKLAGPSVRKVGLFARHITLVSDMPCLHGCLDGWGRALGREHLDTLLLSSAAKAGASVWQPWTAVELVRDRKAYVSKIISQETHDTRELRAPIVIAAHGSWESGLLPTQGLRQCPRPSDLFGFKAHLRECELIPGVMPVIAFPGGYGGLVHTDSGRITFGCCIRRDYLERARRQQPKTSAAEVVMAHIQASCLGVRQALASARLDGPWLSVGPIRPGIRTHFIHGIFLVGNAACEAHPIIGEGITMAMQSAWLLCQRLIARQNDVLAGQAVEAVGREYAASCQKSFAMRLRAAALFGRLAMSARAGALVLPILRQFPAALTFGAWWSGKMKPVVAPILALSPPIGEEGRSEGGTIVSGDCR